MRRHLLAWLACTAGAAVTTPTHAADLKSPTLASGGGTSTAGIYTLTGTIGQPNVVRLHSRDFNLDGGIWSIIAAIQEPGAPPLSVRYTQTNTVVVSWPITWPGFELLESPDLNTPAWTKVVLSPTMVVVGQDRTEKQVVVPADALARNRFYRLNGP